MRETKAVYREEIGIHLLICVSSLMALKGFLLSLTRFPAAGKGVPALQNQTSGKGNVGSTVRGKAGFRK